MDSSPSSLPSPRSRDVLEQITLHMASSLDLQIVLTTITQGLVPDELDGAFARILLLLAGCRKTLWARRNFTGLHV